MTAVTSYKKPLVRAYMDAKGNNNIRIIPIGYATKAIVIHWNDADFSITVLL